MPSLLTRLGQLIPGFTPRPTPPALVVETPEARADRIIAEAKQALDRTRGRPAPSVDEKVPQSYFAGVNGQHWFLPYHHSATADTAEIRAAMRLMIRDAYVKAAWEPLCIAVESEEWQVQPSESGNADAEEQAEFVTANFNDYLKGGVPALVHAIIGQLGPDGFGLAEKVWAVAEKGRLEGKIVLEAAKAKDPDNLHVKGDSFGNVTHVSSTRKGGEEFPITDFLYSRYPGMFDEPLGMAAFRASYGAYWMRDTVRKLRIMHTEKKMAGMLVGTYADGADDDKAKLEASLRAAKSSTWMAIPEGTRVEAVQLSTASEPDYKSHEESLRDEIVTGIAFATLQTMTASVPGEGRGDSEVQKETSELAAWRLMSIVLQVVNEQLIPDLIDYNFPYPAAGGYPKLSFGAISKDEILKDQQVVQAAQQMGLQPSRKHYAKAWSVQLADPNDPDDMMQAGGPQMPPGGGFGGMPGGGMDPFGGGGGGDPFGGQPDPFAFSERWESFAWQPAKSRTGGVKAVGTAEDAGRFLYGRQAEAALARQGRTDRGEPHPEAPQERAKRLAREREPARAEARQAFARALESPDKITPDELAGLGERMKTLTRGELRGFARNMAARVGGLKPELVERLVARARGKAAAADAWKQVKPAEAAPTENIGNNVQRAQVEPARATSQPHPDPLDLTPENVGPVWEKMRNEIANHDPKMSPAQAGSIAAARILNNAGKAAGDYIDALDAKVRRHEPITDEEDAKYIAAGDVRRNLANKLANLSGYRPHQTLDEHPLAVRPFDAPPLEDNAAKAAAVKAGNEQRAGEVAASAAARKAGQTPVRGRIDWDGTAIEDPTGGKTVYRDKDGALHATIAEHGRKQQAAAAAKKVEEQKQAEQAAATKKEQDGETLRQQVRTNGETVARHFDKRLRAELRAAGFGADLLRRTKYGIGGSMLPDDAPKEAVDLRNRMVDEYSKRLSEYGGLSSPPDKIGEMLGKIAPTPPAAPPASATVGKSLEAKPVPATKPARKPNPATAPASGYGQAGADHPLAGLDDDAKWRKLGEYTDTDKATDYRESLAAKGMPKGIDADTFAADVHRAIAANDPGYTGGATTAEVYPLVGKKYGLTKAEFVQAMSHLHGYDTGNDRMGSPGASQGLSYHRRDGYDPDLILPDRKGPAYQLRLPDNLKGDLAANDRLREEAKAAFRDPA